MKTNEKTALCRIVGILLLTDGHLTDEESDFFYGLMDELQLTSVQRAEATAGIRIDADLEPDLKLLFEGGHRDLLLERLRQAATVDGDISPAEADIIGRIESREA